MVSYLQFYSRKDVQKEILKAAKNKEVAFKFGDKGFGKRPEIIQFEGDVFELAKQGATSFHISEESWGDPLDIVTGMTRKQLDELRIGWDLILDIDGPYEISKITTRILIDALHFHDVKDFKIKFSGNKGFHIAIPFKSFPEKVHNQETKDLFPDGPRKMAEYLNDFIKEKLAENILKEYSVEKLIELTGKKEEDIQQKICNKCKIEAAERTLVIYECKSCNSLTESEIEKQSECPQCKRNRLVKKKKIVECPKCRNDKDFETGNKLNPFSIVDIDTILISSRHMFRAPYSINEKSGLASLPFDISKFDEFQKNDAKPENVKVDPNAWDLKKTSNADKLIIQAFDWFSKNNLKNEREEVKKKIDFDIPSQAIKVDFFPPCILKIISGIPEDGRKRALFILINFLSNCGWNPEEVKEFVCNYWNKKNYEPLREGYVLSQVNWYKRQPKNIMPPNCENKAYYKDLRFCFPDGLCNKIRNPVNYAIIKFKMSKKKGKKS